MAKSDPNLLTQAEYARSRKARGLSGGSREAVRKAVDEKRISVFGPDKLIDGDLADRQWEKNTRARLSPEAQGTAGAAAGDLVSQAGQSSQPAGDTPAAAAPPAPVPDGYNAARTRREVADAETAEIGLKKLRGEMLLRIDIDRAGFEIGREVRDAMESTVNSLAAELAPIVSADACAEVLRRHNRAIQDLLVKSFREKVGAPPRLQ